MYELLLKLKERLNEIAIIGLKSVEGDFRLKKLQEKLEVLSSKAPVLGKLYELVTKLLEGEETMESFIQLNNLVSAILHTQGLSKVEGEEAEIEIFVHPPMKSLTFMQLQEVRNILNGGTSTKWANLKKAYDNGSLIDYRLLGDFLDNIGDTYEYTDYDYSIPYDEREPLSMVKIIEQFGEPIIPILLDRFDGAKPTEKANIVKIIEKVGKDQYSSYYKKWIENEEADAVVVNALRALGCNPAHETFLLSYKTRKKKLQEARLLALAKIGTETAKEEIKKYCLKDEDLFITVFNKSAFLDEKEFLDLVMECAQKINEDKELERLSLYRNKNYMFFTRLTDYFEEYDPEQVIETVKKIMTLKNQQSELCFEARIGSHTLANALQFSHQPELVAFLASIKDDYNGYYIADSFMAALKCYDSAKVYDEFAELTVCKYPNVKMNIKAILEDIASKESEVHYNDACATCDERETCHSSTFKPQSIKKNIILDGNRHTPIDLDKIKWDKRWTAYAKSKNLSKLVAFFGFKCMDEKTKKELKEEYIHLLEAFKAKAGDVDSYPNMENKIRKQAEGEMKNIIAGLFMTGASEIVIEHIIYFSFYLGTLEQMMFKYLQEEDLPLLDKVSDQLDSLSDYKKRKIAEFIEKARKIVYAKNGKLYGEAQSCH